MEIRTYRELESTDELLPLLDHAFRWTFNRRSFEQVAKMDPRLKDSPIGFCGLENGHIIGFVGVMDLSTRTLKGNVEYVGGVYGVATLPGQTRKGICTALFERVHEYFREKGYRFSVLGTSHTIVAYGLYRKLGYADLFECPSAYKLIKTKQTKLPKRKTDKPDLDKMLKIYNERVKGKTGFVVRDAAYFKLLKKTEGFTQKECIVDKEGYVLFKEVKGMWVNGIWIRELVAINAKQMNKLLDKAEAKAKEMIYDRAVMDEKLLQVYRSRGYMVQERSHGVMMVKPLAAEANFGKTYGDRFYMTGLDFF